MNIITRPQGSDLCYCRPDTTWERENKDFYVPDSVDTLYWTPIVFVRISKAGKCIGNKFVSRYYDAYNYGVLLYCNRIPACHPEGVCHPERSEGSLSIAFTSCADHTSRLPFPLQDVETLDDGNIYKVYRNGEEIFSGAAEKTVVEDTICRASQTTSLRIGDFVAVELDVLKPLAGAGDGQVVLKGGLSDSDLYDFKLLF